MSEKTAGKPQERLTRPWRHHTLTTPLLAAGTVYAAGEVANMAGLSPLYAGGMAVAGLGGTLLASAARGLGRGSLAYVAAAAATAGGWLTYACGHDPFTAQAVVGLATPTLALGPFYGLLRRRWHAGPATTAARVARLRLSREGDAWPHRLARIGCPGMELIQTIPTRAGYTLRMRLPATGRVTRTTLTSRVEAIEIAGQLRKGSVRVEGGQTADEVLIHITERDVLAETTPLPDGHEPLSINDPIPVGLYEDGSVCTLTLREVATLIVGLRGKGKSNLINVILAQVTRCVDVVVWMIDLKGGRTAKPWLEPWLSGRADRPVIDWVATTREEAERMLDAGLRVIDARAHSGEGGEKITPSGRMPAVLLVCDEIARLFGAHGGPKRSVFPPKPGSPAPATNAALAGKGMTLTQLGRSEAFDPMFATQRGTVTMVGNGDLKSQCDLRIGLGVATAADARSVFPDDVAIAGDMARLTSPGSMYVQVKQDRAMPAKSFWIEFERIARIAEANTYTRPGLDELSARAAGADYANRWSAERAGHLMAAVSVGSGGGPTGDAAPDPTAWATGQDPAGPTDTPTDTGDGRATGAGSWRDLPPSRLVPPPPGAAPTGHTVDGTPLPGRGDNGSSDSRASASGPDPSKIDFEAEFQRIADGFAGGDAGSSESPSADPRREQMLNELRAAGADGATVGDLMAKLQALPAPPARQSVHKWLADLVRDGRVRKLAHGRYAAQPPTGNPQ